MSDTYRASSTPSLAGANESAVSWRAIAAGAVANAALTLVLLAMGSALGFSSVSPWSNAGVSATTFKIATGLYLVVVALLASTVGGYMAGRLRTRWTGLHSYEVSFRDTAHGFLSWAFALVLGAGILGATATFLVGGVAAGAAAGASTGAAQSATGPNDYFVDMLLRPAPGNAQSATPAPASADNTAPAAAGAAPQRNPQPNGNNARREATVIFARSFAPGGELAAADRTYLAQLVAQRTGMSQQEAEKRVDDVTTQAKAAADKARKAAAALSIWLTISMFVGAFAASLAAIEGGQLRDGTWKGVIGARGYQAEQTR